MQSIQRRTSSVQPGTGRTYQLAQFRIGIVLARELDRLQARQLVSNDWYIRRRIDADTRFVSTNPQDFDGNVEGGEVDLVRLFARENQQYSISVSSSGPTGGAQGIVLQATGLRFQVLECKRAACTSIFSQPGSQRLRGRDRRKLFGRREFAWQALGINAGRDCLVAAVEINSTWLAGTYSEAEAEFRQ